jgi:hypothetical protein
MSSYSNMVKDLAPPDPKDIQAYRTWIEQRTPIDYAETRFLEREDDLVAVSPRGSARTVGGVSASRQSAAVWLPLMPLMGFAIVPGLLGRLLMVGVVGVAAVKLLRSTRELRELLTTREWIACFSM